MGEWTEISRSRVEADGLAVDVVLSHALDADGNTRVVLSLEGQGVRIEGEMPGEYWLAPLTPEEVARWALLQIGRGSNDEETSDLVTLIEHAGLDVREDWTSVLDLARDHWREPAGA